MTTAELGGLLSAVKRSHYDARVGMLMFLRRHPHLQPTPDMYAYAVGVGRTVFPSIKGLPEGPFPVFKDLPFFDARLWWSDEQRAWEAEMASL